MRNHTVFRIFAFVGMSVTLLSNLGCQKEAPPAMAQTVRIRAGDAAPNGYQKAQEDTPPVYQPSHWTPKTYWTWQEKPLSDKSFCLRWMVLENTETGGVTIDSRRTPNCKTFEGVPVTKFHFQPHDGNIEWQSINGEASHPPATATSIYHLLFGQDRAATFFRKNIKTPWGDFSGYRLQNSQSIYLDAKETALLGALWESKFYKLVDYKEAKAETKTEATK